MKKLLALILATCMTLSMAACGNAPASSATTGSTSPDGSSAPASSQGGAATVGNHKKFKIGVINAKIDDESSVISKYYQDYIAPRYNCEFVFSEACATPDQSMTAIENFADAGCDAIMSFSATDVEQQALLCQEYGMTFNFNGNRTKVSEGLFTLNPDNFAGSFGADQPNSGRLFSDWMNDTLKLTPEDGFIVCTGVAYMGNAQHIEISQNILTALQNSYGLTYETDIAALAESSSPIEAKNDKGVKIYVYPGAPTQDGWLQGLSAALQTGAYNHLLSSIQVYATAAVIVSEVEASYNKNIVVGSFGTIGDSLKTAFDTKDKFGNPSIDMATVKSSSLVASLGFAELYNSLTGYRDVMKDSKGEMTEFMFRIWNVTSPEEYNTVAGWDKGADTYIANYDVVDSMLGACNPNITAKDIQDALNAVTYDSVKARLG